jgi:outer membrane protein assembly factor BamB
MIRKVHVTNLLLFGALLLGNERLVAEDWPQFRGPHGTGESSARDLPLRWGGLLRPPIWQADIPGRGWSSPIVVGGRVWVTSAEQTALNEESLSRRLSTHRYGDREFQAHSDVTLLAVELDAVTGKLLRRIELFTIQDPPPIHVTNSYASPTPVSNGTSLFCHFGSLGTAAVSLEDGQVIWQRQFALDDITGPGSSPVLDGERLLLACDGVEEQFVVALDTQTGDILWKTARPPIETEDAKHRRSFSTPLLIEPEGDKQLIAPAAQWIVSYDPATGQERWRVDAGAGMHAAVPRPVYRNGVVYVCTGYPKPELWAIRTDGNGNVSDSHVLWKCARQVPEIASPVIAEEEIYFVSSGGVLSCLDVVTGELLWQERLRGSFAASPLWADGKLYFTNTEGVTFVLQPARSYTELAANPVRAPVLASLAVAGNTLLLRSDPVLFCWGAQAFGEGGGTEGSASP